MKNRLREIWFGTTTTQKVCVAAVLAALGAVALMGRTSERIRRSADEPRTSSAAASSPSGIAPIPASRKDLASLYGRFRLDRENNMWVRPEQYQE